MTAFWISTGLLTLLVLAVLCWPLLRRPGAGASRKAINTAIYRDQLAELERDLASGVLSQADYGSARDELERRVLEDVAAADGGRRPPLPRRLPRTALALAVTLPLAAAVLYVVLGTPAALDPAAREGQQASAAEIEKMVDALAAKLEKDPGNPEGWAMLGRSYKVTGRFDDAAKAFDKAGPAMETEPEMMLEVAELSAELNQGKVEGKGRPPPAVLKDQPDNPQALVLAGTDAYFRRTTPMRCATGNGCWPRCRRIRRTPATSRRHREGAPADGRGKQPAPAAASRPPPAPPRSAAGSASPRPSRPRPARTTWCSSSPARQRPAHAAGRAAPASPTCRRISPSTTAWP
jgi:cytochrome c-type biogenesis protein CcmH